MYSICVWYLVAAALESKKPYERKRDEFEFTDCRNYDFEQHLRTRPVHRVDHLEENRKLRMQAYAEMLVRRDAQELKATQTLLTALLGTTSADPKMYLYSTQSLNFKALAMSKLREQVSDDREASYTFSKNFMSQTLAAVDEDEEKKKQIVNSKVRMSATDHQGDNLLLTFCCGILESLADAERVPISEAPHHERADNAPDAAQRRQDRRPAGSLPRPNRCEEDSQLRRSAAEGNGAAVRYQRKSGQRVRCLQFHHTHSLSIA